MKRAIAIVFFLALTIAGILWVSSYVQIKEIEISGNMHNSREEILDLVGFSNNTTVFDTIIHRPSYFENIGYIAKINVTYPTITEIEIEVIEKERMGYVKYMSSYLCLDSNAYIIDNVNQPDPDIPQIDGLNLAGFSLNEPLAIDEEVKLALLNIYKLMKSYDLAPSLIHMNHKKAEDISIQFEKIKVKLGKSERLEEKFSLLKEIMGGLSPQEEGTILLENPDKKIIFQKKQIIEEPKKEEKNLNSLPKNKNE